MHKVTKDAFTLLFFSAFAGIASYFYFFAMTRMLSVEEYSLLYSITALMYILTVPQETIRTMISIYTTKYKVNKEEGKIHELMSQSLKKIFIYSFIAFIVFLALSPLFVNLLHTTFWILLAAGTLLFFAFSLPAMWGFFQGLEKFKALGLNNSIEGFIKLGVAILLVSLIPVTIKIYGALIAMPISMGLAFLIAFFTLKGIRKEKRKKIKEKTTRYSLATFLIFGLVTLMCSVDILIARYFFKASISGLYSGLSLISRSLFFIATGIKRAMVPNLASKNEKKQEKETFKILKKTAILIAVLFGIAFILSLFFSQNFIKIVLSSKYIMAAPYLKYMIISFALFSFSNLLVYYNLVTNRNKKMTFRLLASAAFLEIALLVFFHKSLGQFILVLIIVNSLLLVGMIITSLVKPKEHESPILMGSIKILYDKGDIKTKNKRYKKSSLFTKKEVGERNLRKNG
jgi:O-antigen/teichoic acid export membrane protein